MDTILGILLGESYSGIRALADLSVCIKYTNTYLSGTYDPHSKHEIDRMNSRMKQYSIIAGELYKSGIVAPMLKCISRDQGIKLLTEMHAGMCGAHRGPHEIAHRAIRQGFYWPRAAEDAKELV